MLEYFAFEREKAKGKSVVSMNVKINEQLNLLLIGVKKLKWSR